MFHSSSFVSKANFGGKPAVELRRRRGDEASGREVSANSAHVGSSKGTFQARIVGGMTSGFLELAFFHPVDVIAKRLMSETQPFRVPGDNKKTLENLNRVIFRKYADASVFRKITSMFPGLGFAAGYKIMQRTYKFGGQPMVVDWMHTNFKPLLPKNMKTRNQKILTNATAGAIMGVGEVMLLPLDVLKIKAQTNPEVLKGRGLVDLFRKEGLDLYKGAGFTALRNAPGSFALFGGSALVTHTIFGLEDAKKASFLQTTAASIGGAVSSIVVAAPLDVVKTRLQNKPFGDTTRGVQVIREIITNEGPGGFFKGLVPKIIVVGPKLVFSMTVATRVMNYLETVL